MTLLSESRYERSILSRVGSHDDDRGDVGMGNVSGNIRMMGVEQRTASMFAAVRG